MMGKLSTGQATGTAYWTPGGGSGGTGPWEAGTGANSAQLIGAGDDASGAESVSEGSGSFAADTGTHAEGIGTTARGNGSHAEGTSSQTDAAGAHAEGDHTISGAIAAHAEGQHTLVGVTGPNTRVYTAGHAKGIKSEPFNLAGVAHAAGSSYHLVAWEQYERVILSIRTTDATPTLMKVGGAGGSDVFSGQATDFYDLGGVMVRALVTAMDDTGNNIAGWDLTALIPTSHAIVGQTAVATPPYSTAPLAGAEAVFVKRAGGYTLQVTGVAATNLNWAATVEHTYAGPFA